MQVTKNNILSQYTKGNVGRYRYIVQFHNFLNTFPILFNFGNDIFQNNSRLSAE